MPRRLGEIVREPVLLAAPAGLLFALMTRRRAALGTLAAGALAMTAFAVLAATGLRVLGRYLLLPASLLIAFAAVAALGWTRLPRDQRLRRPWLACAALTTAMLAAFAPAQARRLSHLHAVLGAQAVIADDLHSLSDAGALRPARGRLGVPNHRLSPPSPCGSNCRRLRSPQGVPAPTRAPT